jgi:putative (di)nucleoside polyphosphate hydrolase
MDEALYRQGVCVVLRRPESARVLLCHRKGSTRSQGWQFPQGGVDPLRDLLAEAKRELREEIGTDAVAPIAFSNERYCYDIPPRLRRPGSPYVGQCHRWILAELLVDDRTINFEYQPAEFDAFEWVEPAEALRRVVDFKQATYGRALSALGLLPTDNATQYHRKENVVAHGERQRA